MKIAVCSTVVPFVQGGARNIALWLKVMLERAGHQVESVDLPQLDSPELLFTQMAAFRWIDLDSADRIICLRPQSHLIRHRNKVLWFIHHVRPLYDLWGTPYSAADTPRNRRIRHALMAADGHALAEARAVFTNSQAVSRRLETFNGVQSEVLYPPVFDEERFHSRGFNDEIVCICRLEHHKRQHLLIDALGFTRTAVRLRLCGVGSGLEYPRLLRALIASRGVQDRVTFDERWISEEEKVDHLADCLAAAYVPLDEDSYGYPSVEAALARKPVLTLADAGGVLELVRHGCNGIVADPCPRSLAEAMDRLYLDRKAGREMGENALLRLKHLNVSWPHVLERILA